MHYPLEGWGEGDGIRQINSSDSGVVLLRRRMKGASALGVCLVPCVSDGSVYKQSIAPSFVVTGFDFLCHFLD